MSPRGGAGSVAAPWAGARRRASLLIYLLPALLVYGVFVLWPLLQLAGLSLVRWDGYGAATFVGLTNYSGLWSDPTFPAEVGHSAIWLTVTLLVPPAIGLVLALLLDRAPAGMRAAARALLLVPLLLPTVAIVVAWRLLYNPLSGPLTATLRAAGLGGLAADWLGDPRVALVALLVPACWASFGLSMLIFEAALSSVGREVQAAAAVDGAGRFARLRYITLPHLYGIAPLAVVATALCAAPSFDLILLTTNGGPGYATTTMALDMYGRAFESGQMGSAAALASLQAAVGLALAAVALVALRRFQAANGDNGDRLVDAPRFVSPRRRAPAAVGLAAGALVAIFPVLWLVAVASGHGESTTTPWATIRQGLAAALAQGMGQAFLSGLTVALSVAVVMVALAVPAAFCLVRGVGTVGRTMAAIVLAVGLFQPSAVLLIPLFATLKGLGLLDSPLGVVLPEVARTLPLAVLLLWGAMAALPRDVLAAAAVDGAAPRQALWYVVMPLVVPVTAVVGLWALLASWNEYLLPTVVIQDEGWQTVPLALAHFIGRVDTQYALLAGGAIVSILPLLVLYAALYSAAAGSVRALRSVER